MEECKSTKFPIFIFIGTKLPKDVLQGPESLLIALLYSEFWNFCVNITKEEMHDGFVCGWSEKRGAE